MKKKIFCASEHSHEKKFLLRATSATVIILLAEGYPALSRYGSF